ncbi:MAG: hypothetical protein CO093_09725 [Alphaproteobacteria bacterium CG_4_9_14_3_um_filter_47_13]|nr:MAG: hypothetical protein CO093_09725 [Alphaproteobacteria bacterium CG_4_9_14_3_um_filter_47_13]
MDIARNHRVIENSLHRILEVVMREDYPRSRKDHTPANPAILRRMTLNTIKANKNKGSNRLKFKRAGWDNSFLRKLIAQC